MILALSVMCLKSYAQKINLFTKEFATDFCKETGEIDWNEFVEYNSKQSL